MSDSRVSHAHTLIEDAQGVLTELADEIDNINLAAARFALDIAISHVGILSRQL